MTKSTAGNAPLQLYPPQIKGQTSPVEPKSLADAGVSLAVHDLVPDGNGAHVDVDPPPKGQMQARDEMKLWIEGETAVLYSTIIVDPDAVTALRIPKGRLHPDKVNNLFYTIERNSGNEGTSSILRVLYNRIRPGLKDRYDSPGGHSELKLDLSELIRNGVGADFVSAQVCVSYPYCRAYDRITLKCNGELMHVNVAANQAPQPPNPGSETPITICFTVTRAYLELAKREDQNLIFSFTVTDQLGNGPDTDAPWSPPQTVAEDLDGKLLPKAVLREIEDDTSDDPEIIDLEKLGDKKLTVAILTSDARFQVDDNIEALYTASRAGLPDITEQLSGTVEKGVFEPKAPCILKVTNAKVVADSIVTVVYELFRSKDPIGKSNPAKATVIGTHMELKPPSVQQANGNTLAPMAAVSKLTIVVPQGTTLPTDLLSVSWIPEPGTHAEGTYVSDPRPISEVGLNADAPPTLVAFCLGGRVTVSYTITRGNGQPKPSDPFILNVQELPQAELLAPRLKEASNAGEGTELNLAELTPEGKMWCSGFPFNAVGQYVWLLFKGTKADGSAYEKYIWAAPFAFVNEDWVKNGYFEAPAPYEDLKGLKDGTPLIMEMWVAFGKSEDLGLAKRFLVRTYTVSAVEDVAPTITSVKGSPSGADIKDGEDTVETAVTLTGTAPLGQKVEVFDATDPKGQAEADILTGVWTHPVSDLKLGPHSFTVKGLYGTGQVSKPPYDLTVIVEEDIVIDQFGPATAFSDGEVRDIGNARLTYKLLGKRPDRLATGGEMLTIRSSNMSENQEMLIHLKGASRKNLYLNVRTWAGEVLPGPGRPVGRIIFFNSAGMVHELPLVSALVAYDLHISMPSGKSFDSFKFVMDSTPGPVWGFQYDIYLAVCSNKTNIGDGFI